jgi:hypothetical protein
MCRVRANRWSGLSQCQCKTRGLPYLFRSRTNDSRNLICCDTQCAGFNAVLDKVTGPEREEVTGNGEHYVTRSFIFCIPNHMLPAFSDGGWDERSM